MAEQQLKPARPPIEQFLSDIRGQGILQTCLLYTSDAADE